MGINLMIGTALGSATNAGPVGGSPLRVVATRSELNHNEVGSAATTGNRCHENRFHAYVGQCGVKAGTLRISVSDFRTMSSGEADADPFTYSAHVEFGGVPYVASWNGGQPTIDVTSGSVDNHSDAFATLPELAAGTELWIVQRKVHAVGAIPLYVTLSAMNPLVTGESYVRGDDTAVSHIGTAGALVTGSGWTSTGATSIPVILGEPIDPTQPSIYVAGASIERGSADTWGSGDNGAGGYIREGLYLGKPQAYVIAALFGETAADFISKGAKRRQFLKYCNMFLDGHGGNDYSTGRTSAATLADLQTIRNYAAAAGVAKFGFLRMAPKTNSTDSWTTTGNQTPRTGFATFRSDIDAGVVAQGYKLIDCSSAYEQSGMPGIWKADGVTANLSTTDGTHPSAVRHGDAAAILQQKMIAVDLLPFRPVKIGFGTATATTGWNKTAKFTAGSVFTDMLDSNGNQTGIALDLIAAASGASNTGASPSTNPDFPDAIMANFVTDTTAPPGDEVTYQFSGLNPASTYRIRIMGSRSGTGTRNVDYSVNGGAVQTINVMGNTSTEADFTGVTAVGGTATVTARRGSGNTTAVYFNGLILTEE